MIAARIARILRLRTRSLAEREAVDRELQRELAFHLDHLVAENIAQGMDPAAALAAARRTLGNQASIEEECRDRRSVNWAHDFWQDLRYGARMLRASRAFTVTAVL